MATVRTFHINFYSLLITWSSSIKCRDALEHSPISKFYIEIEPLTPQSGSRRGNHYSHVTGPSLLGGPVYGLIINGKPIEQYNRQHLESDRESLLYRNFHRIKVKPIKLYVLGGVVNLLCCDVTKHNYVAALSHYQSGQTHIAYSLPSPKS